MLVDMLRIMVRGSASQPIARTRPRSRLRLAYVSARTILIVCCAIWAGGYQNFLNMVRGTGDAMTLLATAAKISNPINPQPTNIDSGAKEHGGHDTTGRN